MPRIVSVLLAETARGSWSRLRRDAPRRSRAEPSHRPVGWPCIPALPL